jgi:hypothetical protein
MSFLLASVLTFLFGLWMVAKIWKSSPLMAVISFLFFPAALIPLFQYWGDDEADIKIPCLLTLASAGYMMYSAFKAAQLFQQQQDSLLGVLRLFA